MSTATLPRPPLPTRRVPLRGLPQGPKAAQPNWIRWFILLQFAFQLMQLTSITTGSFRTVIRITAFGISLLYLFLLQGKGQRHPASKPALAVLLTTSRIWTFWPTLRTTFCGKSAADKASAFWTLTVADPAGVEVTGCKLWSKPLTMPLKPRVPADAAW